MTQFCKEIPLTQEEIERRKNNRPNIIETVFNFRGAGSTIYLNGVPVGRTDKYGVFHPINNGK